MQILFIFLAICSSSYFLLASRKFDYFSLAHFSAIIYFLPGFFGNALYYSNGIWTETVMQIEAYWIMIFVMLSIWLSAIIAEFSPQLIRLKFVIPAEDSVVSILMFVTLASFIAQLAVAGRVVLMPEKEVVMESLGRWHILFYSAATLGLPIAFLKRRYALAWIFLAFLGFDLFLGFRSALAISVIATLVLMLYSGGRQRLLFASWKVILIFSIFGAFMFGYKMVAYAVKAGLWDAVWGYFGEENAFLFILTRSEPFLVQQTLNEVVAHNFKTGFDHIATALYQFLLLAPELGAENITFNEKFQPVLFPEVSYGLAANIWAQMWSAGGWPLLVMFTLIFNLVLAIGNSTLNARSLLVRAGFAPIFCYWAFYIHRNELTYALALEKRHLLLLGAAIVIAAVAKSASKRTSMDAHQA